MRTACMQHAYDGKMQAACRLHPSLVRPGITSTILDPSQRSTKRLSAGILQMYLKILELAEFILFGILGL